MSVENTSKLLEEIDKRVNLCNMCQDLVEKFPNSSTIHLGENNDIVLVGEAPANNGWRKSHKVWRDIEAVKCYPLERKNLRTCSKHCKSIMIEQLKILNPKIIITLGEFPTRNILNFKFNKFSDVVGKVYEVDNFKILPIYHPSPISPKSYKGNIPIFEFLKRYLEDDNVL